jgi:hypothetical protein
VRVVVADVVVQVGSCEERLALPQSRRHPIKGALRRLTSPF